jgi:gliding motility-associated-like protein
LYHVDVNFLRMNSHFLVYFRQKKNAHLVGGKIAFFFLIYLSFSFQVFGQSCNCPSSCGPCTGGGLTKLELKFNQPVAQNIKVSDNQDVLFSGSVNALGIVSLSSTATNERFKGDVVTILINGAPDVVIDTRCSTNILVGDTYGSFTVVAATSKTGGAVCCNAFVAEAIRPAITRCPSDINVDVLDQTCLAPITWIPPIASDNCQIVSFAEQNNRAPGDLFGIGRKQIIYTAIDNNGLSRECFFEIKRVDKAGPVFTSFPSDITIFARNSCSSDAGSVTWSPPIVQDCDGSFISAPPQSSGDRFPKGETIVTYSAVDGSGNRTTKSFKVIVIDDAPPTIIKRPPNITVEAQDCGAFITPWAEPMADDNCPAGLTLTSNHRSDEKFPIGTTLITYTATDASGNAFSYSFNIEVIDTSKPVISPLADITKPLTTSCEVPITWIEPTVTDNCEFRVISSHRSGDSFPLGTTVVVYTATDNSGNSSTISFNVIITDETSPIFANCPTTTIEKETDPITCKAKVDWTVPIPTDNCLLDMTDPRFKPGDEFPIGTTIVTYVATDKAGNVATCEFKVLVSDKIGPALTAKPADMTVDANDVCQAIVNWTPPNASDICSAPVTIESNHIPNETFPLGITSVTYKAMDNVGNMSEAFFSISVKDNAGPVFSECPENIVAQANTSCQATVVWKEPTAKDNCSLLITPVSNFKSGDTFEVGEPTRVVYEAVDEAGNNTTCQFSITVVNESVPIITNCPIDIEVKTDETGKAIVTWEEPIAKDRCGPVPLKASKKPGSEFEVGTTVVTYESQPNSLGNKVRCEFSVTLSFKEIILDIGKAVTPDGDRINDFWLIDGLENFKENEVIVVDRWGNKVFEGLKYDNTRVVWNGTNTSGTIVPTGTYFYSISVSFRGKRVEKRGSVEIIH